jgi:hypothetical protein
MHAHGLSMHQKCSNHGLTNLLFGLCRFVWIIGLFIIRPSPHLGTLACLLPQKCYELENEPQFLLLLFLFSDSNLNFLRSLGMCQKACHQKVNKILLTYLFRPIYLLIYLFPFIYQMATKPLNIKNILSNMFNRRIHKSLHYKLKNSYFRNIILSCNDI